MIHKERIGEMNVQEKAELEHWLQESEINRHLYRKLTVKREWTTEYEHYKKISGEEVWKNIRRVVPVRRHYSYRLWPGVAAAVVIFLATGLYLFYSNPVKKSVPRVVQSLSYDSIHPGKQRAVLQLANGQTITLQNEEMQLRTEVAAIRQNQNYLKYEADTCIAVEKINSLTVPQGGEFSVILSDGTKVWLNAKSRLEYPEVFVGDCRKVRLEGEAYFEVEKNKQKPFIVQLHGAEVKVLGTCFNIKAFEEEKRTITTLVEGSVEFSAGTRKMVMKPNQQVSYLLDKNSLEIQEVEATDFIAWKGGKFVFRNERLEYMMEAIARWYNISVFYRNPEVKDILFSGKMDRYGSVKEVLKMIEQTGKVRFELSGSGLIISAK